MYQIYKKAQKAIVWLFMAVIYISEIFVPLILAAQVICRKFFDAPILGAEELASFAFTAMVLFGSAVICYEKKYIVVDVFVKMFPERIRNWMTLLGDILTLIVYGVLMYCFYIAIPVQAKFFSGIFRVPKSVYAIAMLICFGFMCICTIEYVIHDLKKCLGNNSVEMKENLE